MRTAERELSIHTHLQQAPLCAEIAHLKACRKMPSGEYRCCFEAFASDLQEYLCQKRAHAAPIAVQQAVRFALDLSSGLAHLHGTQVAHRDLKPGNVLLRSRGPFHACQPGAAKTKVSAGHQQSDSSVLWQAVIRDFGNSAVLEHPLAMETRRGLQATQLRGERQALTPRVATLWYAAPEMLVFACTPYPPPTKRVCPLLLLPPDAAAAGRSSGTPHASQTCTAGAPTRRGLHHSSEDTSIRQSSFW